MTKITITCHLGVHDTNSEKNNNLLLSMLAKSGVNEQAKNLIKNP